MTQKSAYYRLSAAKPAAPPHEIRLLSWSTRGAMAAGINAQLVAFGFPLRARRQVNLPELWRAIQRGGYENFTLRDIHQPTRLEFSAISAAAYHEAIQATR